MTCDVANLAHALTSLLRTVATAKIALAISLVSVKIPLISVDVLLR